MLKCLQTAHSRLLPTISQVWGVHESENPIPHGRVTNPLHRAVFPNLLEPQHIGNSHITKQKCPKKQTGPCLCLCPLNWSLRSRQSGIGSVCPSYLSSLLLTTTHAGPSPGFELSPGLGQTDYFIFSRDTTSCLQPFTCMLFLAWLTEYLKNCKDSSQRKTQPEWQIVRSFLMNSVTFHTYEVMRFDLRTF